MSHKAGRDFFRAKLEWSKRKDLVLGDYLAPYLPAITTQNRPVLLVDAFAGPGVFDDGAPGSPLLICQAVKKALGYPKPGKYSVWAVEKDPELATRLANTLKPFDGFATVIKKDFAAVVADIEAQLPTHNVFLYLDPFTFSGLEWVDLDRLFVHIDRGTSVEVLMNFNVVALARVATASLGHRFQDEVDEESRMVGENTGTANGVSAVLGGDWWKESLTTAIDFPTACSAIRKGYLSKLRTRFNEVCFHEIKERHAHAVAKYILVFGSRHPKALTLMNDSMAKSLKQQASSEAPDHPTLFETRDETLVPDVDRLRPVILGSLTKSMPRGLLIESVMRLDFGKYTKAEIRGVIEQLIKSKQVLTPDGKTRSNDDTVLTRARPA